ncbi:MAG: Nif3-like dinuclear metal center hexameric protein, partial [Planctomycetes bacterium]|nr:Nif3-like dinuclear metal center hexameric protein [Planctomycetota bacterium]
MAVSVQSIMEYLVSLNPTDRLGGEEGVIHGRADRDADTVLVTWMATVDAIERAVAEGCSIIISHEMLTFHDYFPAIASAKPWTADRAREVLLEANDITVIRAHSTVDPTHVVPGFISALGLSQPIARGAVWSLHEETPISVRTLARKAADAFELQAVRVTGDLDRRVTRIGTMVGGLALDRHIDAWEKHLFGKGAEAIIGGETNDFAQRFAV